MPETTPLIKAALNLRVGAGFDVYVTSIAPLFLFTFFIICTLSGAFQNRSEPEKGRKNKKSTAKQILKTF